MEHIGKLGKLVRDEKAERALTKLLGKLKKEPPYVEGADCPECGKVTILRSGRWGAYYRCSYHPFCDYTIGLY